MAHYPELQLDLEIIKQNALALKERCARAGIKLTTVIKGVDGLIPVIKALRDAGIEMLGTSRLRHIEKCAAAGIESGWLLLRIPQLCECADVVRLADVSLESSIDTVKALEDECVRQGKTHKIILMLDTGDLREGYWDRQRLLDDCVEIVRSCPHIIIGGIGTNFTDCGATVPTPDKLRELADMAEKMKELTGCPAEYVSGGATTSYPLVHSGRMPQGVNHLRIGEAIILNHDLPVEWQLEGLSYLGSPAVFRGQVIEVFDKPSVPVGETATDAFDNRPVFEDRGIRRRAILGFGRLDVGDAGKLLPHDRGVEIISSTSDHCVADIQDCEREIRVGDILSFDMCYENLMYASASPDVAKTYKA